MKLSRYALRTACLCVLLAGCADQDGSGPGEIEGLTAALNGDIIGAQGPLTKKTFADTNEASREADTQAYYNSVGTSNTGTGSPISTALASLSLFRTRYAFSGNEVVARYYNRGDLGIGREMHCVDRISATNEIACYVTNFFAGDATGEFAFGLNASLAFTNMLTGTSFATVAMVYRPGAAQNQVIFLVYNAAGTGLLNAAALDRHAYEFFNGRLTATPGLNQNVNLHIPTNCVACHGGNGSYTQSTHTLTGGFFLPFDLGQFEFDHTLSASELTDFRNLNNIVRTASNLSGGAGLNIRDQIDTFYSSGAFDKDSLPAGWTSAQGSAVYRSVMRGYCRGCHMSQSAISFNTESQLSGAAGLVASDICSYKMPHALQTQREFWESSAPAALETYFNNVGQTAAATTLHNCGPGNIVTLDPPLIGTSGIVTLGI